MEIPEKKALWRTTPSDHDVYFRHALEVFG
jgi:hypothetical protein